MHLIPRVAALSACALALTLPAAVAQAQTAPTGYCEAYRVGDKVQVFGLRGAQVVITAPFHTSTITHMPTTVPLGWDEDSDFTMAYFRFVTTKTITVKVDRVLCKS